MQKREQGERRVKLLKGIALFAAIVNALLLIWLWICRAA